MALAACKRDILSFVCAAVTRNLYFYNEHENAGRVGHVMG